jgi:threonine synthase
VVVISTAHGLKFTDFKVAYHQRRLAGIHGSAVNQPIEVRAEYAAVRERIMREIDRRH